MITDNQKQKYLKAAHLCPYCGSAYIDGVGSVVFHGDTVTNTVECLDCRSMWDDVYALAEIEEVYQPKRKIEVYLLWDSGRWDTDFVYIPADTPDSGIEKAAREAAILQANGLPLVSAGVYWVPPQEDNK